MEAIESPPGPPVIIGGTGGSGTRCLGAILQLAGAYLGWQLNRSLDSLSLTPFLRSQMRSSYACMGEESETETVERDGLFAAALTTHLRDYRGQAIWGWKNPTSMYLLPSFQRVFPAMKFIHLVRDGRDMALSRNQQQFKRFNRNSDPHNLEARARFWSDSNVRVHRFAAGVLGRNYLLVRYEDLCEEPEETVRPLLQFIGSDLPPLEGAEAVRSTDSIGRYGQLPAAAIDSLTRAAREGLRCFGYA